MDVVGERRKSKINIIIPSRRDVMKSSKTQFEPIPNFFWTIISCSNDSHSAHTQLANVLHPDNLMLQFTSCIEPLLFGANTFYNCVSERWINITRTISSLRGADPPTPAHTLTHTHPSVVCLVVMRFTNLSANFVNHSLCKPKYLIHNKWTRRAKERSTQTMKEREKRTQKNCRVAIANMREKHARTKCLCVILLYIIDVNV